MPEAAIPSIFIVGCVRSGTTILHKLLLDACPSAVDLTDDDFESRPFWQAFGLRIGSRLTGTFCDCARMGDVKSVQRQSMQAYLRRRCANSRIMINKNPHLINKIGFVAEILPTSRFVHIIREAMSVTASIRVGFEAANTSNESYPPFVHYWPEGELPCWWTIRNDCPGPPLTSGTIRRVARETCYRVGLKKRPPYTSPSRIFAHKKLSRIRRAYPDLSRYYPGEGFARIPEAWLIQNVNILHQLSAIAERRWFSVSYSELVTEPQNTIRRVLEFAGVLDPQLDRIPQTLDLSRAEKWKTALTEAEQREVRAVINSRKPDLDTLCRQVGTELLVC